MANESTTKVKVDLSDLKKEFRDAQRHIQLVNSEFKEATAGMGKWSNSADGVSAKLKQLNGVLQDENTKLKSLESQYALVAKEQGENSKGAQELMIKINKQKAAIKETESSIAYYNDKLKEMEAESKQTASASDKLRETISKQESDLNSLKSEYANLVLEQGKTSQEAQELSRKIEELSSDLKQNKSALNDAESAADQFDKSLDDVEDSAKKAGDGFTVMKGALADLLADGIKSAAGALKDFVVESDSAYSKFQAQTGASTEEMKDFKKEMDELYENAYGENLQDIGDKMAYVKQVTGEVDPSKLKELTENAITLEDTFGSDFNETIRGVSNLMTHFGIDSEEAFDLFAKGSQEGLDYTGELGDNIAEYGGNFEQAGYSAEEYFQLLVNGSKNGAYNLDKVNDSINEVKNRLADGTIEDSIDSFSEGTQSAFKAWKSGKGTMKDVIDSIVDDINNCENEQEALTMAATAFGTMGEDANLKVVKSLKSTGDSFANVKGKMEEVKKVRYDDVGTQFKTLGRTLMNELVKPLAEKALPQFEKLSEVAIDNMDKIIPVAKTLGVVLTGMFVTNKIAGFVTSLKTLIPAFALTKTATDAQTASTLALNTAWLASPITWLIAGTAALVAAYVAYNKKVEESIEKEYGLTEAQEKSIEASKNLKKSYDEMNQSRNESMQNINAEYGYIDELKNEYNSLIDSNGKVKEGYEDRANFIINQLSQALGIEKEKILENVDANGQLGDSIDQIIEKKKAEATLSANEAAYTEAIQKRSEALSTYQDALTTLDEAESKYNETKDKAADIMENYQQMLISAPQSADGYLMANKKILTANDEAKKSYEKAKKGVEDAETAYVGYNTTIQNYEGLSSAIISGDTAKINDALQNMQNNFITAENGTKDSLKRQVDNLTKQYEDMKAAIESGTPGVTQAQVDAAKQMVDKAAAELDKLPPEAGETAATAGVNFALGLSSTLAQNEAAAETVSLGVNLALATADTKKTGEDQGTNYKTGVESTKKANETAAKGVSLAVNTSLGTADTKKTGANKGSEFTSGLDSTKGAASSVGAAVSASAKSGLGSQNASDKGSALAGTFNAGVSSVNTFNDGAGRAKEANKGLASVDATGTGDNFTAGFKNGMSDGNSAKSIWGAAWNLGKNALNALKESIKEGSPSKETAVSGKWFVLGFANEIADMTKVAVKQAQNMGQAAVQALTDELDTEVQMPAIGGLQTSMTAARKAVQRPQQAAGSNTQVTNNYNFYQTNNSPKALSRLEIYRQTKNQLNFAKGV